MNLNFRITFFTFLFISTCVSPALAQVEKLSGNDNRLAFDELFFEATKKKTIGNEDIAIELFNKSLNIATKDALAQVHYELSKLYNTQNSAEKALYHGQQAINLDPDNEWYYISMAEIYRNFHQYGLEAEVLMAVWPLMDYDLSIMLQTAEAFEKASDMKACLNVLSEIEKRVGPDKDIIEMKSKVYLRLNQPKKAEKELLKLVRNKPEDPIMRVRLFRFYLMNDMEKKAVKYLSKSQKEMPESSAINLELAEYYRQKGDEKNFLNYMLQSLKSRDLDEDARIGILFSFYQITQSYPEFLPQAYQVLAKSEEYHPKSPKIAAMYGDFLVRENRLSEAKVKYLKAISFPDGKKNEIYNQLLFILMEEGEYEKAIEVALEAIEEDEDNLLPYLMAGIGLGHYKRHDEAIEILLKGEEKSFVNKGIREQILINLGENYHRSGQYELSDKYFEKSLNINPSNFLVLNNYAYYLSLRKENLDKALVMAKQVVERFPDNPTYLDTYAWVLYQKGEYSKALEVMEKVMKTPQNSGEVWEHYGDILYKNKKVEEAKQAWKKAQSFGDASEHIQDKIDGKDF